VQNSPYIANPKINGFTLIEVLAALVVSSVLIIAMIGAVRFSDARGETARISQKALQLAVAKMDDVGAIPGPLRSGTGREGKLFWRRDVRILKNVLDNRATLFNIEISTGEINRARLITLEKNIILATRSI
jgi:prepilin-type N-terminal cleavage/methylation domain-containing protein